jgi:hypothetical protein
MYKYLGCTVLGKLYASIGKNQSVIGVWGRVPVYQLNVTELIIILGPVII